MERQVVTIAQAAGNSFPFKGGRIDAQDLSGGGNTADSMTVGIPQTFDDQILLPVAVAIPGQQLLGNIDVVSDHGPDETIGASYQCVDPVFSSGTHRRESFLLVEEAVAIGIGEDPQAASVLAVAGDMNPQISIDQQQSLSISDVRAIGHGDDFIFDHHSLQRAALWRYDESAWTFEGDAYPRTIRRVDPMDHFGVEPCRQTPAGYRTARGESYISPGSGRTADGTLEFDGLLGHAVEKMPAVVGDDDHLVASTGGPCENCRQARGAAIVSAFDPQSMCSCRQRVDDGPRRLFPVIATQDLLVVEVGHEVIVAAHREGGFYRLLLVFDIEGAYQFDGLILRSGIRSPDPLWLVLDGSLRDACAILDRISVDRLPRARLYRFPLDTHRTSAVDLEAELPLEDGIGCGIPESTDGDPIDLVAYRITVGDDPHLMPLVIGEPFYRFLCIRVEADLLPRAIAGKDGHLSPGNCDAATP